MFWRLIVGESRTTTACTWSWNSVAAATSLGSSGEDHVGRALFSVQYNGTCSLTCSCLPVAPSSKEYQKQQELGVSDTACSLELTRFYVAELVNALEYMHTQVQRATPCICVVSWL